MVGIFSIIVFLFLAPNLGRKLFVVAASEWYMKMSYMAYNVCQGGSTHTRGSLCVEEALWGLKCIRPAPPTTRRRGNGWMDRGTNSWRSGTAMWAGTPPAASCCWADGGPTPGGKQSCCQLTPAPGNFAFNMKQCKEILKKSLCKKSCFGI